MGQGTYMQGPIQSGSHASPDLTSAGANNTGEDRGFVVLSQTITLQAATATNVDGTITLPAGSRILDIKADSSVAWTATTASLTVGRTAGGTDYVTGFDVKTITRGPTAAFTATQLGNMDIGTNTSVVCRVASTGANAVGTTRVTVQYMQLT